MAEVDAGSAEDKELEVMVTDMVIVVVAKEYMVEGAMVITYMRFPSGTEHSWHRNVYTLQKNVDYSPRNNRIIFKK